MRTSAVVLVTMVLMLCGCAGGGTLTAVDSNMGGDSTSAVVSSTTILSSPVSVPAPRAEPVASASSALPPSSAATPTTTNTGSPVSVPAPRAEPDGTASSAQSPTGAAATPSTSRPPTSPELLTLDKSKPVRIQVPAIDVDSGLLDLGLQDDGAMQVPPDAASLGWFTGAPTPGQLGPAVIVGHVDWAGELGSFHDLGDLNRGDNITITREDGSVVLFRVTQLGQYPKDEFPTDAVYANTDHAALRLITCGGEFDRESGNYLDNIIVFADMVQARQ